LDEAPVATTALAHLDTSDALLTAALDTAKALADKGQAMHAVLSPEQRVLAGGSWAHNLEMPVP